MNKIAVESKGLSGNPNVNDHFYLATDLSVAKYDGMQHPRSILIVAIAIVTIID